MPPPRKPSVAIPQKVVLSRAHPDTIFQSAYQAHQAGQLDEAISRYRQVLALNKRHADAAYLLGVIQQDRGNLPEAELMMRQALAIREDIRFLYALGGLLYRSKRLPDAELIYRRAIVLKPDYADAHVTLGMVFKETGRLEEAEAIYKRAIALNPASVDAHYNLGNLLKQIERFSDAEAAYRQALAIWPDFIQAHYNLASLFKTTGRLADAEVAYRRTLALHPHYSDAHNNLGLVLEDQGRIDEALASCHRALEIAPGNNQAHLNYALLLLYTGQFEQGWREYEYRWKIPGNESPTHLTQPLWLGKPDPAGKRILLYAEQGYGDTLQFIRYAPLLAARGATVYALVPQALKRLAASCSGIAAVFSPGDALPQHDYRCPLLSLPLAFNTSLHTIPTATPYLASSADAIAHWQKILDNHSTGKRLLRVGLTWAGDPRKHLPWAQSIDRQRSLRFDQLHPLLDVSGIQFFSLQFGAEAASQLNGDPRVLDVTAQIDDFYDTAALVASLDLILCVDTSMAHLVGAVGKPVWMLNRFNSCWRWLRAREDSPWYPKMRIFRQPALGDWDSVIADVRLALENYRR